MNTMQNPTCRFFVPTLLSLILVSAASCGSSGPTDRNAAVAASSGQVSTVPASAPAPVLQRERIVAYYFHGDRRCRTCLGIQETIERTIAERFPAETASGRLEYREVNFEQEQNKHFVQEFQLSFGTMIVAKVDDDKILEWENCGKVWDFGHEPPLLVDYVAERINAYLSKLKAE